MHEDGAAFPLDPRHVVVAEHEHEIVESVGALQSLGASPRRQPDEPVVVAVGRIVAPAVMRRGSRAPEAACAAEGTRSARYKTWRTGKRPQRGSAIAFALERANARAAERRLSHAMTEHDPRLAPFSRRAPDEHRSRPLNPHDRSAFYAPRRRSRQACPGTLPRLQLGPAEQARAADEQRPQDPHHRR